MVGSSVGSFFGTTGRDLEKAGKGEGQEIYCLDSRALLRRPKRKRQQCMKLRPGDDQWTHLLSSSIFTFFFCMCSSFSIFLTTYNTSFFFFFPFSLRSPLCGTTLDFFCHLIIIIYLLAGYGASPAICHRDGDKFVKAEKGGCVRAVPRASCLRGKRRALCGVLVLGVLCCCGGRLSEKGGGTEN